MTLRLSAAAASAAFALSAFAAGAANAVEVEIRDAVARVVVIPEDRADVAVEVVRGSNAELPAVTVTRTGSGKVVVDGDLGRNRIRGCNGRDAPRAGGSPLDSLGGVTVRVRDIGEVRMSETPIITVRTPRDVDVEAGGAVFGWVGRAASVELANKGCGDWTVGDTAGALKLSQAGSGDTTTGRSASLSASIAGSGDVKAGPTGTLNVSIAGSGDVAVASVNGAVEASIAGSGDVSAAGGRGTALKVSIAGSGNVDIDAPVESVRASIMGSGDVRVRSVSGEVKKSVMGSGSIHVGG